jgi:DNA-binding transcriptional regulator YhcF (GntR family)
MQIEIDPLSPVPLYQQLRDRVVEGIAGGAIRPGDQLAPVRQLAARFGINIATVSKGYDLLRTEGLVRANRSAGSVVARGPGSQPSGDVGWNSADRDAWAGRLATVLAEGVAQGEQDESIVAAARQILAGFAAQRDGVQP